MPQHSSDDLAATLYASVRLLAHRLRETPALGELSVPQRSALSRLRQRGEATTVELARADQITPQAMATTLAGLEELGYVRRRRDPDDGRRIIMSLTDSGVEVMRHRRAAQAQRMADALEQGFSARELKTLTAAAPLLQRLAENI